MVNGIAVIAIFAWPFLDNFENKCPANYGRYTKEHSFCKPSNATCSFIVKGLQDKEAEIAEILEVHNQFRSKVAMGEEMRAGGLPSASNMLELTWDEELAQIAQRWAEQCLYGNDCSDCRRADSFSVGQNIAYAQLSCGKTCENINPLWTDTIKRFCDEVINFNKTFVSALDFSGKMTAHFTQVAWAETYKIGCGYVVYKYNEREARQFYVCNYGPAGSLSHQPLYKKGPPCSNCPINSCCGDKCLKESYPGLCRLLSSPPVFPLKHKLQYYCAFEKNDRDCEFESQGAIDWELTETSGGNFLTVVAKENQTASVLFHRTINSKKGSCMVMHLRKGPNSAGDKEGSKIEVVFEPSGEMTKMKSSKWAMEIGTYAWKDFTRSGIATVPFNGDIKFSIRFSVPPGMPPQYLQLKKIEIADQCSTDSVETFYG